PVSEMLRDQFPTVIVSRGNISVGTLEKWNVCFVPIPILIVPKRIGIKTFLFVENLCMGRRKCAESDQQCGYPSGHDETQPKGPPRHEIMSSLNRQIRWLDALGGALEAESAGLVVADDLNIRFLWDLIFQACGPVARVD